MRDADAAEDCCAASFMHDGVLTDSDGQPVTAVLKANSPSCGYGRIYDGNFNGTLTDGDGITAALFRRNGIQLMTEKDLADSNFEGER